MEAAATTNLPAVTTRLILYRGQPCADLEITLHDKPFDSWPEAGWLCLPLNVTAPQYRLGRLGSIIDPAQDIITGANRHMFGINTGVSMTDERRPRRRLLPDGLSAGQPGHARLLAVLAGLRSQETGGLCEPVQ